MLKKVMKALLVSGIYFGVFSSTLLYLRTRSTAIDDEELEPIERDDLPLGRHRQPGRGGPLYTWGTAESCRIEDRHPSVNAELVLPSSQKRTARRAKSIDACICMYASE